MTEASQTGGSPEVSVVVATHERPRRLAALLRALRAQELEQGTFEVIVVDDDSGPETGAVLEAELARGELDLRAVRRERAGGPAAARNTGWPLARAPLVAFTDDDCEPVPEWLAAGLARWNEDRAAAVQGPTLPLAAEAANAGPFSRTVRADRLGPFFQTSNMFYPRELLERLAGFDAEAFPRSGEDTDLAWRARSAGTTISFAPEAIVHHAVNELGPLGKLRVAARWTDSMQVYVRYPELRRTVFTRGVFWKLSHYLLLRAGLGLMLARRAWPLAAWLVLPYLAHLRQRGRDEGGGPAAAPYFVLHDGVEMAAVVRAAVRYRAPLL